MSKVLVIAVTSLPLIAGLQSNMSEKVECGFRYEEGGEVEDPFPMVISREEDGTMRLHSDDGSYVVIPKESTHLLHSMVEGQSYVMRVHVGPQEGAIPMVRTIHGLEMSEFMPIGDPRVHEVEARTFASSRNSTQGRNLSLVDEEQVRRVEMENAEMRERLNAAHVDLKRIEGERDEALKKLADRPTSPAT